MALRLGNLWFFNAVRYCYFLPPINFTLYKSSLPADISGPILVKVPSSSSVFSRLSIGTT